MPLLKCSAGKAKPQAGKREQFQQMLKDSANKEFNYVLVYKLDRFARNRYDSAINKATLKKNGVKVLSACEQITDSPEGIILESMIEGFEHTNGHNKLKSELKQSIQCKITMPPLSKSLMAALL